jgi:hypothetical protein
VTASITLCCEIVEATTTTDLTVELQRTLQDLGLADRLKITHV